MINVSGAAFRHFIDHQTLVSSVEMAVEAEGRRPRSTTSSALIAMLGADLLNAAPGDFGAMWVRWDSTATNRLATMTAATAMNGAMPVNAILLAAILGRYDLADRFRERGKFSLEAGLQWLVLHGVCEHRLWHFVDQPLRNMLLRPVINAHLVRMPGLGALVLRERPELARRFIKRNAWQTEEFKSWLREEGVDTYRLFWLFSRTDLAGWAMRNWTTHQLQRPVTLSQLSKKGAARLQFYAENAIGEHIGRIDQWRAAGRPDVVTVMRPFSAAAQLLINGPSIPSKDGWLTLPEGQFTVISPVRKRASPFVMVEMIVEEMEQELSAAASWGDIALPVTLYRAGRNCCLITQLPAAPDQHMLGLLHIELFREQHATSTELIRMWNI